MATASDVSPANIPGGLSGAVVVAVDGSRGSLAAVEWAACEAASRGLTLRLVNVIGWPYGEPGEARAEAATLSAEVLAEAGARARTSSHGVAVTTESVWGRLGPVLAEEARNAHTLVLGHRDDTGYAGMVLGSRSVGVATYASGPVVVVPEQPRSAWRPVAPTVVVGVDGGPSRVPALAYAFDHAAQHGMVVEVVVAEPVDCHQERAAVGEALRNVSVTFPGVAWRERRVTSTPVDALTAAAAADAALLVVGCRSRFDRSSPLLGSVSRGAIFLARCPVAVV
jgi:nucleotide-binding universal stress UspA family protein